MTKKKRMIIEAADALSEAAVHLSGGFLWSFTPEGHDYWEAQHDHLLALCRQLKEIAGAESPPDEM